MKKRIFTIEHREKLSKAHKCKIPWNKNLKTGCQSQEIIEKRRQSLLGHIVTEETRKKISEAQKGANIENSLGVASGQSYIEQFNKGLKPSTKAKSLIKRTGSVSPLNFNVYASASRGSKGVLLDFHMTEPIKTARRTINEAEKFLKEWTLT